jgi:hypothetical protein
MSSEFFNFANLSTEARLNLVKTLLASPTIDAKQNLQIITNLPFTQETGKFAEVTQLIKEMQDAFLETREDIDQVLRPVFSEVCNLPSASTNISEIIASIAKRADSEECQRVLFATEITCLKSWQKFIEPGKYKEAVMVGAMSHYAVNMARQFYKETSDENIKLMERSFIIYFAAIEGLALGVYINSHVLALYPDAEHLNVGNGPMLTIRFDDEKELKKATIGEIFEGKIATPVSSIGEGYYTSITVPKDKK